MIRTDIIFKRVPPLCDTEKDREAYCLFREAELIEPDDPDGAVSLYMRCAKLSPALARVYGL